MTNGKMTRGVQKMGGNKGEKASEHQCDSEGRKTHCYDWHDGWANIAWTGPKISHFHPYLTSLILYLSISSLLPVLFPSLSSFFFFIILFLAFFPFF